MRGSEAIAGLGAKGDFIAQVPGVEPVRLRLTPDEAAVFAAVGRYARISEVLARSGLGEAQTVALLLSLRAKGAIVPARVQTGPPGNPLDAALLEEVELSPERKQEILDLERGLDRLNHFEVLGLLPSVSDEALKKAYYDASRRYHPDRYYGKNLGSFRARVDRIFRRLSEAYQVLSDGEKRAAYLKAHPELAVGIRGAGAGGGEPVDPARAAERRARFLRHPYLAKTAKLTELLTRARAQLERGELALALVDLQLAVKLEPTHPDAQTLLDQARRSHEHLRAKEEYTRGMEAERLSDFATALQRYRAALLIDERYAQAAFRAAQLCVKTGGDAEEARKLAQRAVEAAPKVADYRALWALLLVDSDKKQAKQQAEEAVRLEPDHPEAKKVLKKLRWPF